MSARADEPFCNADDKMRTKRTSGSIGSILRIFIKMDINIYSSNDERYFSNKRKGPLRTRFSQYENLCTIVIWSPNGYTRAVFYVRVILRRIRLGMYGRDIANKYSLSLFIFIVISKSLTSMCEQRSAAIFHYSTDLLVLLVLLLLLTALWE